MGKADRMKSARSEMTRQRPGTLWRVPTVPILAFGVVLALAACAQSPDLDALEASFDAPPDQREVRVSARVSQTEFGRTVARAVEENPRLDASNADVLAARAREDGEAGGFLPRFSLGVTLGSGLSGGSMALSPILELMQLIYDGGATASRQIAARARVFESRGARLEVAAALALEAVEAWQNLVAARAQHDLARENEAAHRSLLAQVQERSDAGAGTQSDVLTAQARLADAVARRVQALSGRDRAEAVFREIFDRGATRLSAPPVAPTLSEVPDDTLIASSPRVRGIDASIKAAEADLAATRAARFPQVDLRTTGRREVRGDGIDTDLDLLLDYDSGAPGQKAAAIRESEARLAALRADRDSLAREIRRALAFARSDQRTGLERVRAARDAVDANEATVAAGREEFSIGRRGLIGLLDAQRDLFEAGERLIVARREQALSGYVVLALTGDILDAFAITLPSPDAPEDASPDVSTAEVPA
jgi:outer membrane protein TolC